MEESSESEIVTTERRDPEIGALAGLFDAPAFARRGNELAFVSEGFEAKLIQMRSELLSMVHVRSRQWVNAAGPESWRLVLDEPLDQLAATLGIELAGASTSPVGPAALARIARELRASVERFNMRWTQYAKDVDTSPLNRLIERYNRYYLLEKECALGSARASARHFRPVEPISAESILKRHPPLPVPRLR